MELTISLQRDLGQNLTRNSMWISFEEYVNGVQDSMCVGHGK